MGGISFLFLLVGTVSGMDQGNSSMAEQISVLGSQLSTLGSQLIQIQEQVEVLRQKNVERVAGVTSHWEEICNASLSFSEDTKSWSDAGELCELLGGNLVEIRSMEMNYCILLHPQLKGLPVDWYWHSGNDIDNEGVYRYNRAGDFPPLPGDLITWSPLWVDWEGDHSDEPNGGQSQCLMFSLSSDDRAGKWADQPCTYGLPYICQRKL